MTGKTTLTRHADLMDRMANAVGVDLEQAMMEGRMTMDQLGDAVLACTGCTNPENCAHLLADQCGALPAPPDYCRNSETLLRLREGKSA